MLYLPDSVVAFQMSSGEPFSECYGTGCTRWMLSIPYDIIRYHTKHSEYTQKLTHQSITTIK